MALALCPNCRLPVNTSLASCPLCAATLNAGLPAKRVSVAAAVALVATFAVLARRRAT